MRKLLVVLVTAVALTLGTVGAASAQGRSETAPNCERGLATAIAAPGAANRSEVATARLAENLVRCLADDEDEEEEDGA